jgi:hypothetical protein
MIKFRTQSGSIYVLDGDRWVSTSVSTRTADGPMIEHSPVEVGQCVVIHGPGLVMGDRIIVTTPVVEVLEQSADA